MYKGQQLAAEEINAPGGLLGKRKIEILKADENAGTDANVKELRRLKLSEKIDFFCGITSSGNTPALGPVAEELKVLTIFVDGCTDFLFDKAVPNPHYVFRITNIQSADGVTARAGGRARRGRRPSASPTSIRTTPTGATPSTTSTIVMKKMMPKAEIVSEGWPKLGTTDFTSHITKAIVVQAGPPRVVGVGRRLRGAVQAGAALRDVREGEGRDARSPSAWRRTRSARTIRRGSSPACTRNYHFTYPGGDKWPYNKTFVEKYHQRFNEYPNFQAEGGYTDDLHAEGGHREGQQAGRAAGPKTTPSSPCSRA